MADIISLAAEPRTQFGKGAARRLRRAEKIPAVLYGHGNPPLHLSLPGHDTMMALKYSNALLSLTVDGQEHLALAKDVQRDPIKRFIEHVDLVIVLRGEKVSVDIPVHVEGEAAPETLVSLDLTELTVEADATNIPESVTVSVEGLEAGSRIYAGEVELPEGVTLETDPEYLVVNVSVQQVEEEPEEEELEAAEGEGDEGEAGEGDDEEKPEE